MRWWPALALALAAGALGCGTRETSGRARVLTLFDITRLAEAGEPVVPGTVGFPNGIPTSYFVSPELDANGDRQLTVSTGFVDGQVMFYTTTELWVNFDRVWAQPLYRALTADGKIDDPQLAEPWVFGVGPDSLFYSPFWDVFGFQAPAGVDVATLLDTRAVLEAANSTGGLRRLERRITVLVPEGVAPNSNWGENHYLDDTAAWDGVGGGRYLDFGTGRFDVDASGVVLEFPIFIFVRRNADGELEPFQGWPTVGGTRAPFSHPPRLSGTDGGVGDDAAAGAPAPLPPDSLDPNFGGLWRMYTVELSSKAGLTVDSRVLENQYCETEGVPCHLLDSQRAVEALGPERIHRTELLATCPLLAVGQSQFPRVPIVPPIRPPTP